MMKTVFVLLVFVLVGVTYASTDYTCLNDCTAKGYMYNYCQQRCSYDDNPYQQQQQQQSNPYQVKPIPQVDYTCLNNCTQKGYMYNYCKQQCSY
jgi:hypothetical protein